MEPGPVSSMAGIQTHSVDGFSPVLDAVTQLSGSQRKESLEGRESPEGLF